VPDLVVKSGSLAGRRITVEKEVTLGREDTDLVFEDDGEVSRRHAAVRPAGGRVEIEDLGSTNGTFVNDRRVAGPTVLSAGDKVRIGQTTLEVEAAPGAADTIVSEIPAALKDRAGARPGEAEESADVEEDVPTASLPRRDVARRPPPPEQQRDWRPWVAAAVLIALVVAAFLLFFGGDDFASAADEVCGPAAERVERLDMNLSANRRSTREDLNRLKRIRTSVLRDLRNLDEAGEGSKFFRAFGQTQRVITGMISSPGGAAQGSHRRAFDRTAKAEQRAAEDLGLGSCAELTGR
jgi:pSer/pThr/pTyr-binding forkhead associated (FHA) protein